MCLYFYVINVHLIIQYSKNVEKIVLLWYKYVNMLKKKLYKIKLTRKLGEYNKKIKYIYR